MPEKARKSLLPKSEIGPAGGSFAISFVRAYLCASFNLTEEKSVR